MIFDFFCALTAMAVWAGVLLLVILVGKTLIDYTAERLWGRTREHTRDRRR